MRAATPESGLVAEAVNDHLRVLYSQRPLEVESGKAATFVFKRHLHEISLFVFQAHGLPWPAVGLVPIGPVRGSLETSRGFHVLLWREGDLGYALVSDVDEQELLTLAGKIAAP